MLVSQSGLNYDELLTRQFVPGNFLQSSIWKNFLGKQNKKFWQLIVTDNQDKPLAICVLSENKLFFGKSYLYAPKGPIFVEELWQKDKQEALQLILSQIRDITIATQKQEELFCKIEPSENVPPPPEFIKGQNVQPANTWVLDLTKDNKDLLADMHAKTRYNIALAQRRGVKVVVSKKADDLKYFTRLLRGTAARQKINFHPAKYYQLLWETLLEENAGSLYLAEVDNKIVAANMLVNFGQATTYLHGVSDYNYRQTMAPHLLQWQAIKDAKSQGKEVYDFWGVTDENNQPTNWQGITRFKKGFGGRLISSPGAQIFVYNKQWYRFYLFARRFKR